MYFAEFDNKHQLYLNIAETAFLFLFFFIQKSAGVEG